LFRHAALVVVIHVLQAEPVKDVDGRNESGHAELSGVGSKALVLDDRRERPANQREAANHHDAANGFERGGVLGKAACEARKNGTGRHTHQAGHSEHQSLLYVCFGLGRFYPPEAYN
jgi:hypothetical protein